MREILFRGQNVKPGQRVNMAGEKQPGIWVYGGIFPGTGEYSIIYGCPTEKLSGIDIAKYPVYSDTVGQFTGFYDATKWEDLTPEEQQTFLHQPDGWENTPDVWPGKRIFEGDILEFADVGETGYEYKEGFDFTNRAAVAWGNGRWMLERFLDTNSGVVDDMTSNYHEEFTLVFQSSKVIGNIHDNPELLQED